MYIVHVQYNVKHNDIVYIGILMNALMEQAIYITCCCILVTNEVLPVLLFAVDLREVEVFVLVLVVVLVLLLSFSS